MSELSEEDVKLLESLEAEGLLSKNVSGKVRAALRIANVAGRRRSFVAIRIVLSVLCCCLIAAAVASPFAWLSTLCGTLAFVDFGCALAALLTE